MYSDKIKAVSFLRSLFDKLSLHSPLFVFNTGTNRTAPESEISLFERSSSSKFYCYSRNLPNTFIGKSLQKLLPAKNFLIFEKSNDSATFMKKSEEA